jgi:hypothetical protein
MAPWKWRQIFGIEPFCYGIELVLPTGTASADTVEAHCRNMIAAYATPLREIEMRILHILGVLFIVAWLVLWLALKVTFAAIHVLVVIGIILIVAGLLAGRSSTAK